MAVKRDQPNLLEWLGFRRKPDFSKAVPLGYAFGFLLVLFALVLSLATLATLWNFVLAALRLEPYSHDIDGGSIRNIGLVLVALLGAPFLIWRSVVAAKQAEISDEALFNDKINAAAKDLAARREVTEVFEVDDRKDVLASIEDDLVSRAAAIDRLEGLAGEREDAAPRIVRLLATYVRGNFSCENLDQTTPPFTRKIPRMDLQKAVDSIGRVHKLAVEMDRSHWRLDLKGCDFDGVSFQQGYFFAADFSDCRMEACNFREANFDGCLLRGSLLNFSDFMDVNFTGAKLDRVTLSLSQGWIGELGSGTLRGATFAYADLTGVSYLGRSVKIAETFGTSDTKVFGKLKRTMPKQSLHESASLNRRLSGAEELTDDEISQIEQLEKTGFQNWSPYPVSDLANGSLLAELYKELGLDKWPYR
jgi:uncharacterized protein YjbI with pentapeptide repeats